MIDLSSIPRKDPAWRAYVSSLRCTLTSSQDNVVPHHVRLSGFCGMGQKPHDLFCIPLTYIEHARIHTQGMSAREKAVIMEALVRLVIEYFTRRMESEEGF